MYIRSSIIKQESGLWKATIVSSWMYFGEQETHESFNTLGEARDWLLENRCYNLEIEKVPPKKEAPVEEVEPEEEEEKESEDETKRPIKLKIKPKHKVGFKTWKNIKYNSNDVPVGIVNDDE